MNIPCAPAHFERHGLDKVAGWDQWEATAFTPLQDQRMSCLSLRSCRGRRCLGRCGACAARAGGAHVTDACDRAARPSRARITASIPSKFATWAARCERSEHRTCSRRRRPTPGQSCRRPRSNNGTPWPAWRLFGRFLRIERRRNAAANVDDDALGLLVSDGERVMIVATAARIQSLLPLPRVRRSSTTR